MSSPLWLTLILQSVATASALVAPTFSSTFSHAAAAAAARHGAPLLLPKERTAPDMRQLFVDGNNLMSHRKVTKGRDELAAKLSGIRGCQVVLVYDGKRGEAASTRDGDPQVIVTYGGEDETGDQRETADEWIERAIDESPCEVIEVVTADRGLRRIAQAKKVKTINPAKFWQRYLPRLRGQKNDYRNAPKSELLE